MSESIVLRTPLIPFRSIDSKSGKIFLKPENLQVFGSYKIRGVYSAIQAASPSVLAKGLSTASAGNMAQAVAFLARQLDIECQIFVPDTAPEVKKQAIRKIGANLIELPFAEVWNLVKQPPRVTEGLFIHPVFTPGLLEGYGSIAEELLTDRPSLDAVIIPFGVGGLTLGMARVLKRLKPSIHVYACEPETAAPLKASLQNGRATSITRRSSFVDAIGTPEVLPEVFLQAQELIGDSLVMTLPEIRDALKKLALEQKLICEGAAAASLAAALRLGSQNPEMEIACVLTGGNISSEIFKEILDDR